MRYSICSLGLFVGVLALTQGVHAQVEPVPPQAMPPAPPAECVPNCRSGFMCISGQCVSNCNPPCAQGEQCSGGECVAPPAAQPEAAVLPPPDPGIERHDGFMLRLALGFGWGGVTASADSSSDDVTLSGFSASFSFDIGGAIVENLVLHARFSDLSILNPTLYMNGEKVGESEDASLTGVFFGPALTYYIMPANLYLTLGVGMSWLTFDTDVRSSRDRTRDSDLGFGLNFDVGKEWWVSDNWGLGLAARFWYTHVTDTVSEVDAKYDLLGFAVFFSATYN